MTTTEPSRPGGELAPGRRPAADGASGGERAAAQQVTITSAAAARRYVRSVVDERCGSPERPVDEQAVVDLLIVVSELVTNAIRHGGGIAGFTVEPVPGGVRLGVRDYSDVVPEAAHGPGVPPRAHVGNGYGWPLIIRLARDIRIERHPGGGKTVGLLVPLSRSVSV